MRHKETKMPLLFDGINSGLGMVMGFLVGLIPLILVHEIGHFVMAKLMGVWAREFGIGYPPRMTKLFRWGETDFTLNWLPLGGFVRMEGEQIFADDEDAAEEKTPEQLAEEAEAREHSLYAKSPGKRIAIYLGGPIMNIITAWVLAALIFMTGVPAVRAVVGEVAPGSPAAEAGMHVDDVVVAINGENIEELDDVFRYTQQHLDTEIEVTLERDGQTITTSLVPRSNPPEGQGAMGIVISGLEDSTDLDRYPIGQAFVYGSRYLGNIVGMTVMLPVYVIRGLIPIEQARPVGVIGISQIAQRSVEQSISTGAIFPYLNLLVLISMSLGLFNLVPIPALDGGRILFAIVEKLRKRPLTPALEERVHMITLAILFVVFVVITVLDIVAPVAIP